MDAALFEKYLKNRGVTETPYANRPISVENDIDKIVAAIGK